MYEAMRCVTELCNMHCCIAFLIFISSRLKNFDADESTIEVRLTDIFSPLNGSVYLFNIIVIERNEFLPQSYIEGTITDNLTTWAAVSKTYLHVNQCYDLTGNIISL